MQTRILVTHGVNFLPYVDEIVVLVDGVVSEVGSYKSLRASKGAFSEFLETYAKEQRSQSHSDSGNDFNDYNIFCHFVVFPKTLHGPLLNPSVLPYSGYSCSHSFRSW